MNRNCSVRLLRLRLTQKALQLPILVFFLAFLLVTFSGHTTKSLLANVLILVIKKTCDQDLTHSLETPKHISVKIVPQVVIRVACGTWHGLCTVTSINSIQKTTRNCQNRPPETLKQVIHIMHHAVMNKKRDQMQFSPEKRLEKRNWIHPTYYSTSR